MPTGAPAGPSWRRQRSRDDLDPGPPGPHAVDSGQVEARARCGRARRQLAEVAGSGGGGLGAAARYLGQRVNRGQRDPGLPTARAWTCRRSCGPLPPLLVVPTRCTSRASSTGPSALRRLRWFRRTRVTRRSATSGPAELMSDRVPDTSGDRCPRSSVSGERGAARGPGWVPTSRLHGPSTT